MNQKVLERPAIHIGKAACNRTGNANLNARREQTTVHRLERRVQQRVSALEINHQVTRMTKHSRKFGAAYCIVLACAI